MADFPTTLPRPLISSYGVTPENAMIRTDFDVGPARQRKRFTATPRKLDIAWTFNSDEMPTFLDFYETTVNHGTDWFNYNLDIGKGFMLYSTRFTQPYKAIKTSYRTWNVSTQLEVENA